MKKVATALLPILLSFVILISCSAPTKSAEEENVLSSLINIQNSLEANISYDKFVELLEDAKVKVDLLKRSENKNAHFLSAVDKCYASYEIARKAWKLKMETQNEKRKQDIESTFSFSISFASLNIEKANNYYK